MMASARMARVMTIIWLSFFLLGCSADYHPAKETEGQVGETTGAEYPYVGTEWTVVYNVVELPESSILQQTVLADGYLFVAQTSEAGKEKSLFYVETGELLKQGAGKAVKGLPISASENTSIRQICAEDGGSLLALAYEADRGPGNYALHTISVETGIIEETRTVDAWTDIQAVSLEKDSDGYVYLGDFHGNNAILVMDSLGEQVARISTEECHISDMIEIDSSLYGVGLYQGMDALYRVDKSTWKLNFVTELPESRGTVLLAEGQNHTLLYGYQDALYQYDIQNGVGEIIYTWANIGYEGRHIHSMHMDEEGNILLILENQKTNGLLITCLQKPEEEDLTAESTKKIVTVYGNKQDSELAKAVGKFNTLNETYNVEIVNSDYGRLLVDIMAGNGPDLFQLRQVGAMDYVSKGVIEDLTPYLEGSDLLSAEMLNQRVLELCTVNDVLTCIPASFSVGTLWGKGAMVGEEPGWTLEEFLSCVDMHRGVTITEGSMVVDSGTQLMLTLWHSREDKWIDWTNREARFRDGEFEELLTYATEYEALYDGGNETVEERWKSDKVLLYTRPVTSMERYLYLKMLAEGDLVAKGYPRADGEVYHKMNSYGGYAINSKSENKEGAWEFIEFLLLNQTAEATYQNGIPVVNAIFEETLIQDPTVKKNINGYEIPIATEEDILAYRELIDNICTTDMTSSVVGGIIQEEIEYSISGQRAVSETVNIIQNRVQLYLDEMD